MKQPFLSIYRRLSTILNLILVFLKKFTSFKSMDLGGSDGVASSSNPIGTILVDEKIYIFML